MMTFVLNIAFLCFLFLLYCWYLWCTRISVTKVPGPPSQSFLHGNMSELLLSEVGEAEFKWQASYGDVVRLRAPLGNDVLLVSDPKALQYIYQTAAYQFPKHRERQAIVRIMAGPGLLWSDGDNHKRQRRVMQPGFGAPESKAFLPTFHSLAAKLSKKWEDLVVTSEGESAVVDIPSWTSRATLDAIGEAAFDYQFGALDNPDNELRNAYNNVFLDTFGIPSKGDILFTGIATYMPDRILRYFVDKAPTPRLYHIRQLEKIVTDVARKLVRDKSAALLQGLENNDVMSLIVKANASKNRDTQLTEEEMIAQMQTILLAGHETTANSLSWTLLELSKKPAIQCKLRQEIRDKEHAIQAQGRSAFTPPDFDSMPFFTAVVKESFRMNPIVYSNHRQAGADEILPLAKPITTSSGEIIHELPIPKGIKIITSISGYNRNPEIYGKDSHTFNPDRWLSCSGTKQGSSVGVYANLLTFAGGPRACIGWRFAVLELQAFLAELISKFEFSMTPEAHKVRRESCLVMTPTIEGQLEKGTQLPLRIQIASREESVFSK